MRVWAVTAGLIAGLLVQAAPVVAHGKGHAARAGVSAARDVQAAPTVCEIDPAKLAAFLARNDNATPSKDDGARDAVAPASQASRDDKVREADATEDHAAASPCKTAPDAPSDSVGSPTTSGPLG